MFSFATNYKNRIWRNEVMQKKQEREAEGEKKEGFNMKEMSR